MADPIHDPILKQKIEKMSEKVISYMQTEVKELFDELDLLTKMNKVTTTSYLDMSSTLARPLIEQMEHVRERYDDLLPQIEELDAILSQVDQIADIAKELDAWSLDMETRINKATLK